MAKSREQHILALSTRNNASANKMTTEVISKKLKASSNPEVQALGDDLETKSGNLNTSILAQIKAKKESEVATKKMHQDNNAACKSHKTAAKKIEELYPNNPILWTECGFAVSSDMAHDQTLPGKVVNGMMEQGKYKKQCTIYFDAAPNVDHFTVEMTVSDPSDTSKYVLVRSPRMIYTTTKITFDVPDDFLDKYLWVKVTAHNTAGDSPVSDPFGGMKIQ